MAVIALIHFAEAAQLTVVAAVEDGERNTVEVDSRATGLVPMVRRLIEPGPFGSGKIREPVRARGAAV